MRSTERGDVLVDDEKPTTADLLEAWRETTRAADLAERLATIALEAADHAERDAEASEDIARMAERAAKSSERAAQIARKASDRAAKLAQEHRTMKLHDADRDLVNARETEAVARDAYHRAERQARRRHDDGT